MNCCLDDDNPASDALPPLQKRQRKCRQDTFCSIIPSKVGKMQYVNSHCYNSGKESELLHLEDAVEECVRYHIDQYKSRILINSSIVFKQFAYTLI